MTRTGNERNPLIEAAQLNAKPASVSAAHIRTNRAGRNFAPVRMRPPNSTKTDVCAASDESLSSESVQIQLQSILQANRSRGRSIQGFMLSLEIVIPNSRARSSERPLWSA